MASLATSFLTVALALTIFHVYCIAASLGRASTDNASPRHQRQHTSNYAIILSTSRYYFNYRHNNNVLSMYQLLKKRGGFPDSNIILMLAQDFTCDARNPFKNTMYTETEYESFEKNLAPHTDIEVDYRGDDVNPTTLARILLGRHQEGDSMSRKKLVDMNEGSNLFFFMAGHGGDSFFKFHDHEEITTADIRSIFSQMYALRRYNSIFFVTDTCQAFTLSEDITVTAPNVISMASSLRDENSYARHSDRVLGISVIDRFSYSFVNYLNQDKHRDMSHVTVQELVNSMKYSVLHSTVGIRGSLDDGRRGAGQVFVSEFLEDIRQTRNAGWQKNYKQQLSVNHGFVGKVIGWNHSLQYSNDFDSRSYSEEDWIHQKNGKKKDSPSYQKSIQCHLDSTDSYTYPNIFTKFPNFKVKVVAVALLFLFILCVSSSRW